MTSRCMYNIDMISSLNEVDPKYKIVELGCGSFGTVYKAKLLKTKQIVAVKELDLSSMDKHELQLLNNEIEILKDVNHSGCNKYVVCYHGFVKHNNFGYIFMEYIDGKDLDKFVFSFKYKDDEKFKFIYNLTSKLLKGLKYIHDSEIIHGDIKPPNIIVRFVDGEYIPTYVDFGLSCKNPIVSCYGVKGSPYYMDPVLLQKKILTEKGDVWSLGVTILDLVNVQVWPDTLPNPESLYKYIMYNQPNIQIYDVSLYNGYNFDKIPKMYNMYGVGKIPKSDSYGSKLQSIINVMVVKDINKRWNVDMILKTFFPSPHLSPIRKLYNKIKKL